MSCARGPRMMARVDATEGAWMARQKDPLALLASVPLFEGLSKRELSVIYRAARRNEYPAGRTIVTEGASGVAFHLVLSGRARVTVGGRSRASLGPGDFFGELSLLDRGPRSATVTAETGVLTLSMTSWEFLPLLDDHPKMSRKVLAEMARRLRDAEKSVTH